MPSLRKIGELIIFIQGYQLLIRIRHICHESIILLIILFVIVNQKIGICPMFVHGPNKTCQHPGIVNPEIIAVHISDQISSSQLQSDIASIGQSSVEFMNDPNPSIARGQSLAYSTAFIGRSIIDEQDFDIAVILIQNTGYGLFDILFRFIYGNNYRN